MMMTREQALAILELHKTIPQKIELLRQAINVVAQIKPPEGN